VTSPVQYCCISGILPNKVLWNAINISLNCLESLHSVKFSKVFVEHHLVCPNQKYFFAGLLRLHAFQPDLDAPVLRPVFRGVVWSDRLLVRVTLN